MNTITNRHPMKACRYPNDADSRYFWNRLMDTILCTASTVCIVAVLSLLIILF